MSYEPIVLILPVIYAALQFDAIKRMENSWKSAAYLPAWLMMIGFGLQVMLGILDIGAAAWMPVVSMCLACVYLTALNVAYDRVLIAAYEDEIARRPDNVVSFEDFHSRA